MTVLKVIEGRELSTEERLQLLEQIGNFSITPASLLRKIMKAQNISYVKKHSPEGKQEYVEEKQELIPEVII